MTRQRERASRDQPRVPSDISTDLRIALGDIFLTRLGDDMYGEVLDLVLRELGSRYGVFACLDEDGAAVAPSMARDIRDKCHVEEKSIRFPRDIWGSGTWEVAVREKRSVIANQPGRVPPGHLPIKRSLATAILHDGEVIGYFQVADKETDYDEGDREKLEAIAACISGPLFHRLEGQLLQKELLRNHAELEVSEAHYRSLFDAIDEGFCIVEAIFDEDERPIDYRFLQVNAAFEKQTGLIDAQGKRMRELRPKHEEHWFEIYGKIALTGQPARFSNIAEQLHRWYDVYAFRVGRPEDRQVGILFNDITERKRAEEALRESEEQVRQLFEAVPQLVWTCQPEGPCDYLGPQWVKYTGVPEVPQLGYGWLEQVHRDDRELTLASWLSKCAAGADFHVEFRIRRHDGVYRWFDTHAKLMRDLSGCPTKWFGSNTDITERKQAEELLRLTQYAVDHAADCVYWLSPGGQFLYANNSACSRLGYSWEELSAMSVWDITVGMQPEERPARWEEIKKKGSVNSEKEHRTKSGEIFPVEITTNHFEYGGREYNFASVRDITERKQAEEALGQSEEQLRQSQKMEAVGQLAGGIAHDFNNLLTAILGYSDMILASKASSLEEVRSDVEEIKLAGERASALTKQILAFSRRQTLRPAVVSLNEVLTGVEPLLRRTLGENIDLVSVKDPDLGHVEADVHQFEQVIMNLALNARDAMVSGGRLTLETANVELGEEYCRTHPEAAPGRNVMLSVSDTGVGMDEATCERVFEPFFTTKAPGQGTGLGLATVYGIVRQSDGSISVYSERGKGTSFKIYLPLASQPGIPAEIVIPSRESAQGSETVMVVEDEAALRSLIERILGGAGYTTLAFGSAVEALGALERGECSIDLLLTDVMLPGALQGDDLARAVRAARPELPVLFMSGYPRNAIVHAGRLDEGVNFLEKPFTPEALANIVRIVLEQPRGQG